MVPIEYRTYIPRGYGLIGFIIISFLYEELAARARENHATTEYLQARYTLIARETQSNKLGFARSAGPSSSFSLTAFAMHNERLPTRIWLAVQSPWARDRLQEIWTFTTSKLCLQSFLASI